MRSWKEYYILHLTKYGRYEGFTVYGDRIVEIADVISTISRYNKEKFGVTIVKSDGDVLVRFDSNTENIMRQYNNINSGLDKYIESLKRNTTNKYNKDINYKYISKTSNTLLDIYGSGAAWYGNDIEIQKRIVADINGTDYTNNGQKYEGKNLLKELKGKTIVEVTNEIDQSKYLEDNGNPTNLLQQYKMPTVEIIYIILE